MTWGGVDNFNSYSPSGTNIDTGAGGSGWSTNWAKVQGAPNFLSDSAQVLEGAFSMKVNYTGGVEPFIKRQLTTSINSGASTVVHFAVRRDVTATDTSDNLLGDSGITKYVQLQFNFSGNVVLVGATSVTVLTGYSANTWYHVYIDMDITNGRARAYVATSIPNATPAWSAYVNSAGGAWTTIDIIRYGVQSGGAGSNNWWDDIRDVGSDFSAVAAVGGASNLAFLGTG